MAHKVVSKNRHSSEILRRKQVTLSPNKLIEPRCSLGLHMNSFLVDCAKELALEPCIPQLLDGTTQELKNQALNQRKFLCLPEDCSRHKKRSFETFMKGDNFCGTKSEESSNSGSVERLTCSDYISGSCLSTDSAEIGKYDNSLQTIENSCNFDDTASEGKQYVSLDAADFEHPTNNIVSSCLGMDESVDGCQSQPSNPENLILHDGSSVDSCDQIQFLSSKQNIKLIIKDEKNPPRPVIPRGPRFQAEIPEWKGSVAYKMDTDSNKWLGTRVWPIDGGEDKEEVIIGRGRPRSCSCLYPGSAKCVRYHIFKAKEELQSELGAAFFTWEFDKMGEVVAKSFSSKQERRLESLLKDNPFSREKDVWDFVMKHFPSKSESSILSYYYNVFIPRRLSIFNRSSLDQVESDEDQASDDDDDEEEEINDDKNGGGSSGGIRRRWLC